MHSVERAVIEGLRVACGRVGSRQVSLLHAAQDRSDYVGVASHTRRVRAVEAIVEAIEKVAAELEGGNG